MALSKEPFCTNPKCQHHSKLVYPGASFVFVSKVSGKQFSQPPGVTMPFGEPVKVPVNVETIERFEVCAQVAGLTIKGKLCDTCMEVLRMLEGWK
jgi:hypothetical protein